MADRTRIEQLRRRVLQDPASVAFAQLAEEHRRAGEYDETVRVARDGLKHHPAYLSARVTLARALTQLHRYGEAKAEFQYALSVAPDNLAAIRGLADLHQRLGEGGSEEAAGPDAPVTGEAVAAPTPSTVRPDVPPPPPSPALGASDLDALGLGDRAEPPADERLDLRLPDREPAGESRPDEFDPGLPPDRPGETPPTADLEPPASAEAPVEPWAVSEDPALEPLERWMEAIELDRLRIGARGPRE